jgi:nucleotide-binding universal stress UspA family protein
MVTLDGSELSRAALPHASTVAKSAGAAVVVTQVIDSVAQIMSQLAPATIEPLPAGAITAELAEESVAGQRAAAQENLDRAAAQLRADGIASVSTLVVEGRAGEAIVEAAAAQGCDLIVLATHGRTGLGRALLGSVAEHVSRHAQHAAVLLVRAPK